MKNFLSGILLLFCFFLFSNAHSQIKTALSQKEPKVRCSTMEGLEIYLKNNPQARAIAEQNKSLQLNAGKAQEAFRTGAIATIPVVVHLVLSSADQALVTEADVLWQINKMNEDFSGNNADSANAVAFYPVRGHSSIRFCLAKQDANGNPTNGIDRVSTTITDFTSNTVSQIKHRSSCGADAWDPSRYLNIWISRSTSLLGISTFPGVGPADEQGIAISLDGFSNNPAYVGATYNRGRTLVHETGHYLGLYHIWGDENGCTTSDFRQLPGTCVISGGDIVGSNSDMLVGDTPNQAGASSGCASGERTDACNPVSPGIQYQNFMDYTDDACYSLFTLLQIKRMEYVLNNCRGSLLASNGCVPVQQFTTDISISSILNPGAGACGLSGTTSFCSGNAIFPAIEVNNLGTGIITSFKVMIQIDGGTPTQFIWRGMLDPFAKTLVMLPSFLAPATGTHTINISLSDPNGKTDERTANDNATQTFTVNAAIAGTVTEGFESSIFPPNGWRLINPDNGITWERFAGAGYNSSSSARINIYNYIVKNNQDILVSPAVDISSKDSIRVSFNLSHAAYSSSGPGQDTLELVYSIDCGTTWQNFANYKKWSNGTGANNLATTANSAIDFIPSGTSQWRLETASMPLPLTGNPSSMMIGFKSTSMFGNNIYLDNINIEKIKLVSLDASTVRINNLMSRICQSSTSPDIVIANTGRDTLRSVKVNYLIDGSASTTINWSGTLVPGGTATITLNNVNMGAAGNHVFTAFTSQPNGLADQNTANDTSRVSYQLFPINPLTSVEEGFSNPAFPPNGWNIYNPDGDITWQRNATVGKKAPGSAWFNDFNNNTNHRFDDLLTPNYSINNVDSVFLHFQLSTVAYSLPGTNEPIDTLTVLVSKDCGNTFAPVYKKWSSALQTISDPNFPRTNEFFPASSLQWRRDSINLGSYLGASEKQFQVAFRFSGNYENNIFIDDVALFTRTLPPFLKENGYLILPTITHDVFAVWHYQPPTTLKSLVVYNAGGQTVWKKEFGGNADKFITIDLSGKAAGMYIVSLQYSDRAKPVTQKVVKY